MVLYLIGLGLGDVEDISVKGLALIRRCTRVYLETYTSALCYGLDVQRECLEEFYGRQVLEIDRQFVERGIDKILNEAVTEDIALLIVGDPFGATTHADLLLRAHSQSVEIQVIHNASILSAVGCCGLILYSFGTTVSIVFWETDWKPDSYYDKILINRKNGMHTLCLLDIRTKEQTKENIAKKNEIFERPRFMTCSEAATQLLEILKNKREKAEKFKKNFKSQFMENKKQSDNKEKSSKKKKIEKKNFEVNFSDEEEVEFEEAYTENTMVVGLARVGWSDQKIVYCTLQKLAEQAYLGPPLHSLIIPGKTHPMEEELLSFYEIND